MSSYSSGDGVDGADHHLQARHRSRPGAGAGPEPRVDRRAAAARRSAPARHHHRQELARPDDGRAHAVAGRHLRPALCLQLCPLAGARRAAAARRRRRPHHLRRARIFAAHLARSRKAVRLRHDGGRRRAGAARAERAGLGRLDRRAADRRRHRLPVHGHHAGPLRGRARLPLCHRQVDRGRPADHAAGRGPHRARRQGLRHQLLSQRQAGGGARHLPAAGHQRARRGRRRSRTRWRELSKDFPQGLAYEIVYNPTEFIAESINEVYKTILEAIAAGRHRHHRLPAVLAHGDRADRGHPGVADRHARGALRLRLLAQHADPVRPGAGDRHRRRRRDRRGRERRAQHRRGLRPRRRPRTAPWTRSAPRSSRSRWC